MIKKEPYIYHNPEVYFTHEDHRPRDRVEAGWYFIDETEDFHGPFDTRELARQELKQYTEWMG